ncbi:hypothetical protein LOZ66_003770 [Ophidiomyces ophidiicola]|nr:hypothetical protein LOZ66_003770 [Ophidiomyces ophidiicola]
MAASKSPQYARHMAGPRGIAPRSLEANNTHSSYGPPFHENIGSPVPIREDRVASSIYSTQDYTRESRLTYSSVRLGPYSQYRDSQYTDASPPISPVPVQYRSAAGADSPDISPIDETFSPAVPLPKKDDKDTSSFQGIHPESQVAFVETTSSKAAIHKPDPIRETRWDEFSGEPTNSDRGKFAQASPGDLLNIKSAQKHPFAFFTRGKDGKERRKQTPRIDVEASPLPVRVPWKGASGRSTILNPISSKKPSAEQPFIPPPRKDSRNPFMQSSSATNRTHPTTPSAKPENDYASTNPASHFQIDSFDFETLKKASKIHTQKDLPPLNKELPSQPYASRGEARIQDVQLEPDYSNARSLHFDEETRSQRSFPGSMIAGAGSPPRIPRRSDETIQPEPSSYMTARPTKVTARKPTPSQQSASTSKSLPRSPPEMEANSRIELMEAKLRDLSRRRVNIDTIISELNQVIQPSSITYDMATRAEVTRSVKSLNAELDDIKKEEHDIGLKLHRAYKKKDEGDYYCEPSGLWIRRVTG